MRIRRRIETVIGQLFHIQKVCARDSWHLCNKYLLISFVRLLTPCCLVPLSNLMAWSKFDFLKIEHRV